MYMGHRRVPQHPMKMGVRRKRADSVVSGLKTGDFLRIARCHEHGMDRDLHLDDGLGA
jgi:hypothetical protein